MNWASKTFKKVYKEKVKGECARKVTIERG
jgi:hypothetical protein